MLFYAAAAASDSSRASGHVSRRDEIVVAAGADKCSSRASTATLRSRPYAVGFVGSASGDHPVVGRSVVLRSVVRRRCGVHEVPAPRCSFVSLAPHLELRLRSAAGSETGPLYFTRPTLGTSTPLGRSLRSPTRVDMVKRGALELSSRTRSPGARSHPIGGGRPWLALSSPDSEAEL